MQPYTAKKKKYRQETPVKYEDDPPPPAQVQSVPITQNPSYEPVKLGPLPPSPSSCEDSLHSGKVVTAPSGLPRESYDNVQLKNFAVIPSSCKPLSVAPGRNDYQQTEANASVPTASSVDVPQSEVHTYEEVDLKRSHTVIPTPGLGHAFGTVNPRHELTSGQKATIIFIDNNLPETERFGPRRATTATGYQGEERPRPPTIPHVTVPEVGSHSDESRPLHTMLDEQAEASEDPCLGEDVDHEHAVAADDGSHDEGVRHESQSKMCDNGAGTTYDYI